MLYCLLKEDRVLVFKKTEVFYNGKNQHEMDDVKLDDTALQQVAGGICSVADASQERILSFHCGVQSLN